MPRLLDRLPYGSHTAIRLARDVPVHALCGSVGRSREQGPDYEWSGTERGSRRFAVLQVTLSGCGQVVLRSGTTDVPVGSAMLVSVPGEHAYRVQPDANAWDFVYAVLYGTEALRLIEHVNAAHPVIAWNAGGIGEQALHALVLAMGRRPRASVYELSTRAYALAMALLEPSGIDSESGPHSTIARSIDYLHANLMQPITVEDLARVAGYSRHHFARTFRTQTGLAPVRYLREARCERAAHLLTASDRSIKEIAADCGFESSSYFCRVFQQTTGFTPTEYRRNRP